MAARHALIGPITLVLASWVPTATALDKSGAIEVAKREVKSHCTATTPCTFEAKSEKQLVRASPVHKAQLTPGEALSIPRRTRDLHHQSERQGHWTDGGRMKPNSALLTDAYLALRASYSAANRGR